MSDPCKEVTFRVQEADSAVRAWNDAHPVGTPVWYWPGLRRPGIEAEHSTTRTPASALGGHTPVVWVEGRGDCIALTHVEPLQPGSEFEHAYRGVGGSTALLVDLDDELDVWFTVIGEAVCLDADRLDKLIDDLCDMAARPRPPRSTP